MYEEARNLFIECEADDTGAIPVIVSLKWGADLAWTIHIREVSYDEALRYVVEGAEQRIERDPEPGGEDYEYVAYPSLYSEMGTGQPVSAQPVPSFSENLEALAGQLSLSAKPRQFVLVNLLAVYASKTEWLSLETAAEELGHAGPASFRKAINSGRLTASKRAGSWFVARRDLERAVAEGTIRKLN